ncbi:coenzyme PQQ synthesis protein D [Lachnospiraceae bacterium]|nr:coenzyme PQQ synthesis protein D [Lachnospiraceae bacterium]
MYIISDQVVLHEEEGKKYLVNTVSGKVFVLNEVASRIVEGLNENKSVDEIKHMLSLLFSDVTFEQISKDVDSYITMLVDSQSIVAKQ